MPSVTLLRPILIWFRRDLRLADHPALAAALELARRDGRPLLPVYIDETDAARADGGAARWWLHHSLTALAQDLAGHGLRLWLKRGVAAEIVPALAAGLGGASVIWNRRLDPDGLRRDGLVRAALTAQGCAVREMMPDLLFSPDAVRGKQGQGLQVFTPFWRACRALPEPPAPLAAPLPGEMLPAVVLPGDGAIPAADQLGEWGLLPTRPNWATGLAPCWTPGEAGGWNRWTGFLQQGQAHYPEHRDFPAREGATSRLSPHLAFGEISPRQIWAHARSVGVEADDGFLRQLGWREFCWHMLTRWPTLADQPWREAFTAFPWQDDPAALRRWQRGQTGIPIVDAGMRELWTTGWMHNRVRMIVASWLVKDLLIDWRQGERWFWDTLADADPANNPGGWQWVAGCGFDAAPYFRIFNPVAQAVKFDPDGAYVRRWVPELARLPVPLLHQPWTGGALDLLDAGVRLGRDYPLPQTDHSAARDRALAAFAMLRAAEG